LIALLAVVTMTAMALVPVTAAAQAAGPMNVVLDGPKIVAVSEKNTYTISAVGGPAETGGNYSYVATLSGPAVTDAVISPSNGISTTGKFTLTLTPPSTPQDFVLTVNVTSYNAGSSESQSKYIGIQAVRPVTITAKVVNSGNVTLNSVPIAFYLDDVKVFNTTFSVSAQASSVVIYNITAALASGEHTVRAELDPQNQFARFSGGGSVFTQTIYVNPPDYGNSDGILILLFAALAFVTYIVYKRPKRKRRR